MVMFDDPRDPERLPRTRPEPAQAPATAPLPTPPSVPEAGVPEAGVNINRVRAKRASDNAATSLPPDVIGDIPPPPIPQAPPITGPGVGGIPGTEAGTFARPGSMGAAPFRTSAYAAPRQQRFGPGAPIVGGGGMSGFGGDEGGMGMGLGAPDDIGELLRALAASRGPTGTV